MEDYMLPCLNKEILGLECMGCGIQRAAALFFKGEFAAAFYMYPALYTLLLLLGFIGFNFFVRFKYDFQIKMVLIILNVLIIVTSYFYKMEFSSL